MNAGLSALQGHRHGGQSELVERLFREIESTRGEKQTDNLKALVKTVIAGRLRRGEMIPGFGQPLYPNGDPRCQTLL